MKGARAALALSCAVLLVLIAYHVLIDWTRNWEYNSIRLERTFVLAAGQPIYSDASSGLILNTIYGPLGAVAYLPATLMRTPASAVLAGQVLSLVFVLLPAAVLVRRGASAGHASAGHASAFFGFLLIAALVVDLSPLEYVAFTIHVDAPALALSVLSWAAFLRARGPGETRWLVAAALFASLGVWTKLMLLPLLAALPLWALVMSGRRRALRLAVILAAVLAVVSASMVLAFGPLDRLIFNTWTVPARHATLITDPETMARAVRVAWRLLSQNAPAWALWLGVLAVRLHRRPAGWAREPAVAYGALGLALVPFSILGLLKKGGDINAFSYTLYPVVIGTVLSLLEEAQRSVLMRRLLLGLPAFLLAAVAAFQEPEFLETWSQPFRPSELPHQIAFEYARRHPGEVYFPRLTLATMMAEGKAYHQLVGLIDRDIAGFPPTPEHLRAYLPRNMKAVAFAANGFSAEVWQLHLPELRQDEGRDPELPGFIVYPVERASPGQ